MGCQKKIAEQIVDAGGDYVLALKGNQGALSAQVKGLFRETEASDYDDFNVDYHATKEVSRNRYEVRRHWTLAVSETDINDESWHQLNVIGMVESERTVNDHMSKEYRYYIGSIENDAELFANTVCRHWGVENNLHWQLDTSFREDESRMRKVTQQRISL